MLKEIKERSIYINTLISFVKWRGYVHQHNAIPIRPGKIEIVLDILAHFLLI